MELAEAGALLQGDGFGVTLLEVRSRKGVINANEARVVKQRCIDDKNVELTFAYFRTDVESTAMAINQGDET